MPDDTPWSVERVREVAEQFNALLAMKAQQAATQAVMIRACIAAIRFQPEQWDDREKAKRDRDLAFLHLEWLATQLENQTEEKEPDHVHGRESTSPPAGGGQLSGSRGGAGGVRPAAVPDQV